MASDDLEFKVDITMHDKIQVKKFRSKSLGLGVVHANVSGPLIRAFVVLATKVHDNIGFPHMLEHLIFMGSESYPYNGTLQHMATKCFANPPNAWTDIDHTCFTITAVNVDGFSKIFPVFLDHIFFPLLSDEAFTTEIYHINEAGEDAGVFYTEALAAECDKKSVGFHSLRKLMHPAPSGYHFNYRGSSKSIRENPDPKYVRLFHRYYYHASNCRIIVTGPITENELFKTLDPFILKMKIKANIPLHWKNPWEDEIAPEIEETVEITVPYPVKNDAQQEMMMLVGFRGGKAGIECEKNIALRLLLEYLTTCTTSPLVRKFVETVKPVARSVKFSFVESICTIFYFQIDGIQSQMKSSVIPMLQEGFNYAIANFSLELMKHLIIKSEEEELSSLENTPHNCLAFLIITDFLFGDERIEEPFARRLTTFGNLKRFLRKPIYYWTELIRTYLLKPMAVVHMVPSKTEMDKLIAETNQRRTSRVVTLGEENLRQLGIKLRSSIEYNNRTIPQEDKQIENYSLLPTNISFYRISRQINHTFQPDVRCHLQLDDIDSKFAYISILLDTSKLSKEQRKFLPLYCLALTESAVRVNEHIVMPPEVVWEHLNRVFHNYNVTLGITEGDKFKCGNYAHVLCFNAQLEVSKLGKGVRWLKRIFWDIEFTENRLKVLCIVLLRDIMKRKSDSENLATMMLRNLIYYKDSNVHITCPIRQEKFLKELWDRPNPDEIVNILNELTAAFNTPKFVNVHVATNVAQAKISYEAIKRDDYLLEDWNHAVSFNGKLQKKRLRAIEDKFWIREEIKLRTAPYGVIHGSIYENGGAAYLIQCIPALHDFKDPHLTPFLVAIQYLSQINSLSRKALHSLDMDCRVFFKVKPNEGILYFYISQSSDLVGTYKSMYTTVGDHVKNPVRRKNTIMSNTDLSHTPQVKVWREDVFEEAKRKLIFEIIEGESTVLSLVTNSLFSVYTNTPDRDAQKIINQIAKVNMEQVKGITSKYIQHLFTAPCNCAVVCPKDQVPYLVQEFSRLGKPLIVIPSLSKSYMGRW